MHYELLYHSTDYFNIAIILIINAEYNRNFTSEIIIQASTHHLVCYFRKINNAYKKESDVHHNLLHAQQVLVSILYASLPPFFLFILSQHDAHKTFTVLSIFNLFISGL